MNRQSQHLQRPVRYRFTPIGLIVRGLVSGFFWGMATCVASFGMISYEAAANSVAQSSDIHIVMDLVGAIAPWAAVIGLIMPFLLATLASRLDAAIGYQPNSFTLIRPQISASSLAGCFPSPEPISIGARKTFVPGILLGLGLGLILALWIVPKHVGSELLSGMALQRPALRVLIAGFAGVLSTSCSHAITFRLSPAYWIGVIRGR